MAGVRAASRAKGGGSIAASRGGSPSTKSRTFGPLTRTRLPGYTPAMNMTPSIPLLLAAFSAGVLVTPTPAQDDELLVVEKRGDLAARTRMVAHLRKIFVTVNFDNASARDVAEYIQVASGKTVNVIVSSKTVKPDELPKLTLALNKIRLTNLMSTIETQTDLRFTFNSGMIFLKPKAEVKAFSYLKMYDVRAAVFMATEFIPPKLGLRPPDEESSGFVGGVEGEPKPINGYDIDRLIDLIKNTRPRTPGTPQAFRSTACMVCCWCARPSVATGKPRTSSRSSGRFRVPAR